MSLLLVRKISRLFCYLKHYLYKFPQAKAPEAGGQGAMVLPPLQYFQILQERSNGAMALQYFQKRAAQGDRLKFALYSLQYRSIELDLSLQSNPLDEKLNQTKFI